MASKFLLYYDGDCPQKFAAGTLGQYIGADANGDPVWSSFGAATPWVGASNNTNLTITAGGTDGHAPTFDYSLTGDIAGLTVGAQGTGGGVANKDYYVGRDGQLHQLPGGTETTFAATSTNAHLTITAGGTNGHAPTFAYDLAGNITALTVGTQGTGGGTANKDYYVGRDGLLHRLPGVDEIPISSGVGAPAATANSPTIYRDTATDNRYYRDNDGTVILLNPCSFYSSVPAASFADPNAPTDAEADTYAASLATSLLPGTLLSYGGSLANPDYVWSVTCDGSLVRVRTKTSNTVVAQIVRTDKVGLTAAFDGSSSAGDTLTYVWAAVGVNGTTGTATFATPAAVTSTATFTAPGEYEVTLTVTDASGITATQTHRIKVDRVIEINGATLDQNRLFTSAAAAFAWINANDAANAASYLITINGVTTDAGTVNPNAARVHFNNGAQIPAGVTFNAAGTYTWTADGVGSAPHVTGDLIIPLNTAVNLNLSNFYGKRGILQGNGNTTVTISNSKFLETAAGSFGLFLGGTAATYNLSNLDVQGTTQGLVATAVANSAGTTLNLRDSRIVATTTNGLDIGDGVVSTLSDLEVSAPFFAVSIATPPAAQGRNTISNMRATNSSNNIASAALYLFSRTANGFTGNGVQEVIGGRFRSPSAVAIRRNVTGGLTPTINIFDATAEGVRAIQSDNLGAALAWNPATVYNTNYRGALNGPITFAAGADNVNF